jgi:HSP20 family protein
MAKPPKKHVKPVPASPAALDAEKLLQRLRESIGSFIEPTSHELVKYSPNVDIYTVGDRVVLEIEIPGVDPKDVEISFVNNSLLVKGTKNIDQDESKGAYICMERGFGKFYRAVEMPFPVDAANIKASSTNGVLTIEAAKIDDKRGRPTRIEIKAE